MEEDQTVLFQKIRKGDWQFVEEDWGHISQDAKDLIKGLLVSDPKDRWTIEDALSCPWINKDPRRLSSVNLTESIMTMKAKKNRLKTLARAFMWAGGKADLAQETVSCVMQKVSR